MEEGTFKRGLDRQRTERTHGCQGGGGSGMDGECGVHRCELFHLGWISNEVLLCSPGKPIQSPGIDPDGREYKKGNVCLCMTGSLCCTAEPGTTL